MPFSAEKCRFRQKNAENGISEARVRRRQSSLYNVGYGRMIRKGFDPQAMATPA